jgi:hypothetical protein
MEVRVSPILLQGHAHRADKADMRAVSTNHNVQPVRTEALFDERPSRRFV